MNSKKYFGNLKSISQNYNIVIFRTMVEIYGSYSTSSSPCYSNHVDLVKKKKKDIACQMYEHC